MVEEIKTYKIFIASPGDCDEERKKVREIVDKLSSIFKQKDRIQIELLGWEDTIASGGNRPQSEINKDVDDCDMFLLCMYKRWGTPPGNPDYTSGTEEEFCRAWNRFEKTDFPCIYAFFRIVDREFLKDPGEQLQKVIDFKSDIEGGDKPYSKRILYKQYHLSSDVPPEHLDFEKLITNTIAKWIGRIMRGGGCSPDTILGNENKLDDYKLLLADREDELRKAYDKIETLEKEQELTVSQLNEKYATGLVLAAYNYWDRGQLSDAEAVISKALSLDDKSPYTWLFYGAILDELGRYEEAVVAIDRTIKIKPDFTIAYYNKGNALGKLERYEEAIAAYDEAIRIKPDNPDVYNNKGVALVELERYEEAITAYNEALRIKPDKDEAYYNKGIALDELGRYEEAVAAYDEVIRIKPDYHEAYYNKGIALGELERYEEAIAAYDEAIRIKPDYYEAYENKANVYLEMGEYTDAVEACDKAIEFNSGSAGAYFNRACAYSLLGEREKMEADLRKAIALDDKYWEEVKTDEDFEPFRAEVDALLAKICPDK